MRLHTSLSEADIRAALAQEQAVGNIAETVYFGLLAPHTSRTNDRAFEVQLASTGKAEGEKRRTVNAYGHQYGENGHYGATWSEWGWLISKVFAKDRGASWYRVYADRYDFDEKTQFVFDEDIARHVKIAAGDLKVGDIIVGAGIQGTGIEGVEAVKREGKKFTVTVGLYGGIYGYRYSETKNINPARVLTVCRPV